MVKDKVNYRARGPNTALTHQPVSGRANDGGLRIGEMERDSVIGHGISNFLQESMMERGDKYQIAVCNQSGMIAIYNQEKDLFMSPAIDGPFKFTTAPDGNSLYLNDITRFGRSFSIVSIPYTLKLLMQELQTINMQMRIITEDNIDQLENMSYSKNISKLMMNPTANEAGIAEMIRLEGNRRYGDIKDNVKNDLESVSPFPPVIGTTGNAESPQYPNVSPAYEPNSDEIAEMQANAASPAYVPTSPGYIPTSPAYEPYEKPVQEKMEMWEEHRKYWDPKEQRMTHRFDEATKTWVKNKTFEEIWGLKGGENSDFQIGEPVYLRGGQDKSIWSIKHIGDKFITVENRDPNYPGGGGEDAIQVVGKHELLRPSDVTSANIGGGLSFDKPMFGQMGGREQQNDSNDGKIVFAPQIVVTTGNDNNMTIPALSNAAEPVSEQPESFGGSSVIRSIPMAKMDPVKMDSVPEPKAQEPPSSSSGGGLLDFAKGFFIKKMT
jgi:hypothetical protein